MNMIITNVSDANDESSRALIAEADGMIGGPGKFEGEAQEHGAIEAGAPVVVYPDETNRTVTLWPGTVVGVIVRQSTFRNPFGYGSKLTAYTWRDKHGKHWHGRGAGGGMSLISRRSKA